MEGLQVCEYDGDEKEQSEIYIFHWIKPID